MTAHRDDVAADVRQVVDRIRAECHPRRLQWLADRVELRAAEPMTLGEVLADVEARREHQRVGEELAELEAVLALLAPAAPTAAGVLGAALARLAHETCGDMVAHTMTEIDR